MGRITNSLQNKIALSFITMVIIMVIATSILVQVDVTKMVYRYGLQQANSLVDLLYENLEKEYESDQLFRDAVYKERRKLLRDLTDVAIQIVNSKYQEVREGKLSEQQAKLEAKEIIRTMRYNDGIGYLWINDTTRPVPRMVMHPTIPSLDGKILDNPEYNTAGDNKENLFSLGVNKGLKYGEGYIRYLWPKPTKSGLTADKEKLSYVRLFKPWSWIIGSGVYIDDIEADTHKKLRELKDKFFHKISSHRVGASGYAFIFNSNGDILAHPNLAGTNPFTTKNRHADEVLTKAMKSVKNKDSGVIEYLWNRPDDLEHYIYQKTLFVRYFKPFDWYLGFSVYTNDLKSPAIILQTKLLWGSIIFLMLAVLISWLIAKNISRPLSRLAETSRKIENDGIKDVEVPCVGTNETITLGKCMKNMLESLRKDQLELEYLNKQLQTELSERQEDVILEREFSSTIITSSNLVICCLKPDYRIARINPAGISISGRTEEELLDQSWSAIFTMSDDNHSILNELESRSIEGREITMINTGGERLTLDWTFIPFYKQDKLKYMIGFGYDITNLKQIEAELKRLNETLEDKVTSRTRELQDSHDKLSEAYDKLKETKNVLIESEKMSTLGGMVAGISHEINTPIGIGVAASTHLKEQGKEFHKHIEDKKISMTYLKSFLEQLDESTSIIEMNLLKASNLISSFKQISVDQTSDANYRFNMKEHLEQVLVSLGHKLKQTDCTVNIDCQESLQLFGCPGSLSQIYSNLIMNSIHHGFENLEYPGVIDIHIKEQDEGVMIDYFDNGQGIHPDIAPKIFEQFVTSKRGQGGSGLGTNIIYNLVVDKMKGKIHCIQDVKQGVHFNIYLPRGEAAGESSN
ncbi:cache domain-containing protein [Dongshaea marina]|uniref:cache domain-containing protein n=1 Tax=Dongshaea marina TaxID=2047966 RepID=UPI000D3E3991|nr:cache domain-containing protein [Dongshaea marina]